MSICEGLCVPLDDNNIESKLEQELVQTIKPECKCTNILQSFEAGSFKNNISLVQLNNNKRIVVVYKQKNFDDNKKKDIMKESRIQKKVYNEAGPQYAPNVYRLDYYSTDEGEEIFLMTGYAGDNDYKQLQNIEKIINFMEVYPCVDNLCDKNIYSFFEEVLPLYKKTMFSDESILDEDDIKLCKYYATLFNSHNYENCLEQWYMRCRHFFEPFFRDLHELHKIDVFHHDLRSENIWFKKNDTGYHFKFIDFGISTSLQESLNKSSFGETFVKIETKGSSLPSSIDFSTKPEITTSTETILHEMKTKNFSEQTLKDLIMVEMTRPQTMPHAEQNSDKYREFTFFNDSIFDNITDIFEDTMIRTFRTKQKTKDKKKSIFTIHFRNKNRIINTFKEFIAKKYCETILNQYKN